MNDWVPDLRARKGPRYKRIVAALEDDIVTGRLAPGTRLPTHRALADALGLTAGTVTRAYKEAERRRLVHGHVGRGTFVGTPPESVAHAGPSESDDDAHRVAAAAGVPAWRAGPEPAPTGPPYDLSEIVPASGPQRAIWRRILEDIARDPRPLADPEAATLAARKAGSRWVSRGGLAAMPRRVLATSGGSAALTAALAAVAAPGETVLTESLTDPGLRGIANLLGLNIKPLVSDEQGVRPESFELACWSRESRVLYCMPTLQTPNNATMPDNRREELARIARKYDAHIVENDVFGALVPRPQAPLARLAPDRCFYVASLAKCLDPALAVGFLVPPDSLAERVAAILRAMNGTPPVLEALAATRWIEGGYADSIVEFQRAEAAARVEMAHVALGPAVAGTPSHALQVWLPLPERWRADEFAARCAEKGVTVAPASHFAAGRSATPHAVCIGLGAAAARQDLSDALGTIAAVVAAPPGARPAAARS